MRYGFVTCVRLGLVCIEELLSLGANLVLMGTLADQRALGKSGRVYLDDVATDAGIELLKFDNINDDHVVAAIVKANLDWLFIIGWSQIARAEVLAAPRLGTMGMHPTLLPEGRGRAAIPWAIIKGLPETGVTMFKLDEGMDTGPVLGQVRIPIEIDETSTTLYAKVEAAHRDLIRGAFEELESGRPSLSAQDHSKATTWPGRRPEDGELDLASLTAAEVDRYVRALTRPYPGAFVRQADGSTLRIWGGRAIHESASAGLVLEAAHGTRYLATDFDHERTTPPPPTS